MAVFNLRLNEEGDLEFSPHECMQLDGLLSDSAVLDWLVRLESEAEQARNDHIDTNEDRNPGISHN